MANKKWTEVSQPFQFPPSFTSKSFTLRKMYSRLLHDYEQVYFNRNRGQPTPPPGQRHFVSPATLSGASQVAEAACLPCTHISAPGTHSKPCDLLGFVM
jgi:hypothetical protein